MRRSSNIGVLFVLVAASHLAAQEPTATESRTAKGPEISSQDFAPTRDTTPLAPSVDCETPAPANAPGYSWARAEYLYWNLSGGHVPPEIIAGVPGSNVATPGSPGTAVLFGGNNPLEEPQSGMRISLGTWFGSESPFGAEIMGYWVRSASTGAFAGTTDGSRPIGASPFYNPLTSSLTSVLVSSPGLSAGNVSISYDREPIWGGDALFLARLCSDECWSINGIAGFRAFHHQESLTIRKTIIPLGPGYPPGTVLICNDAYYAENSFHGGVLGVDFNKQWCCWELNVRAAAAVGCMESSITRAGITGIKVPGSPPSIFPGGIYNLITNMGTIESRDWTVLPDINIRLSRSIIDCVRVSVGYSAAFLPGLVRAGEQIDPVVNPGFLPPPKQFNNGPIRPLPFINKSDAILQGFSVGLEVRF